MKKNLLFKPLIASLCFLLLFLNGAVNAQTSNYFNGFETSVGPDDWEDATRVPTGTNGIPSAAGVWHAELGADGGFTRFGRVGGGSYNPIFPSCGYKTSLDIYLNSAGGWVNDTRFDYSSAINTTGGTYRRDFIFNVGFYNDALPPGAGPRFVISASNNAGRGSSFPKNPGRAPQAIVAPGWYTFEHSFRNNGGVLAVDMTIYDATNTPVATWTLSDPSDLIGVTVGGARYGWLLSNEFIPLAVDNSSLTLNPLNTYYADNDGDGYGDPNSCINVCDQTAPEGYVSNNHDCDDTKNDTKVIMCHKGKQHCVKWKDVAKHQAKGWTLGPCTAANCEPGETLMCNNKGEQECVKNKDVQKKVLEGWTVGTCPCEEEEALFANRGSIEEVILPDQIRLSNFPNPFNQSTTIRYELSMDSKVNITLYDPMGRVIATLVEGSRNAGVYNYILDASRLAAGLYFYKMTAVSGTERFVQSQKLMIVK